MSLFARAERRVAVMYGRIPAGSGTLSRPHTVQRIDASASNVTALTVKTGAAIGASSVVLHVFDVAEKRAKGTVPAGIVLVHDGNNYTVQADATFTSNAVTVTLAPVLVTAADVGDSFTLPDAATWTSISFHTGTVSDFERFSGFSSATSRISIPTQGLTEAPRERDLFSGTTATGNAIAGRVVTLTDRLGRWEVGLN